MLETILSPTKGLIGRSYLISGLLPATLLGLGWIWYWNGRAAIDALISRSTASLLISDTIVTLLYWLGLGLLFFYARPVLLQFFRRVPIWPFKDFLIRSQLWKRRTVRRREAELRWLITVSHWYRRDFPHPKSMPESLLKPSWFRLTWLRRKCHSDSADLAFRASAKARAELAELSKAEQGSLLQQCKSNRMFGHLVVFYIFCYRELVQKRGRPEAEQVEAKRPIDDELGAWRKLLETIKSDKATCPVLESIHDSLYNRWVSARDKKSLFPAEEVWVEPTAIGNIFAALDDYANKRYDIDTETLWARLWWVLPAEVKEEVSQAKLSVETLINMCAALSVLAVGIGLSTAIDQYASYPRVVAFAAAAAVLARLSYVAAKSSARALAHKMESAVDVYRLDLLEKVGFKPATIKDELDVFAEIRQFYTQAVARDAARQLGSKKNDDAGGNEKDSGENSRGPVRADMVILVKARRRWRGQWRRRARRGGAGRGVATS